MPLGVFDDRVDPDDHVELSKNCRLLSMAIRKRWISADDENCQRLRAKAEAAALVTEDIRAFTKLLDVIVKMEGQNQKDEHAELHASQRSEGFGGVNVNVIAGGETGGGVVSETVHRIIKDDPEYVEFLRSRAIEADRDPGTVREVGERGPVEDAAAPRIFGPGTD